MSLGSYRKRIDDLDDRILALLADRAELAHEIADVKRASQSAAHAQGAAQAQAAAHAQGAAQAAAGTVTFHDPEREEQVLQRLQAKGAASFRRRRSAPFFVR
jgi:chorismate mutase/prephenate dehydratase